MLTWFSSKCFCPLTCLSQFWRWKKLYFLQLLRHSSDSGRTTHCHWSESKITVCDACRAQIPALALYTLCEHNCKLSSGLRSAPPFPCSTITSLNLTVCQHVWWSNHVDTLHPESSRTISTGLLWHLNPCSIQAWQMCLSGCLFHPFQSPNRSSSLLHRPLSLPCIHTRARKSPNSSLVE